MLLSTNFRAFYSELGLDGMLRAYSEAGFGAVDFSLNLPELSEADEELLLGIRSKLAEYGIAVGQAHAPFPSNFEDAERTELRFSEIVKSIEHAALLGAPYIVIHPLKPYGDAEADPERFFERNLAFYRSLAPYARECGVGIAIENCVGSLTRSSHTLCRLIRELDDGVFSVCFDVGHANYAIHKYPDLGLTVDGMIRELGGMISCTHIHDNDGTSDDHTLPFYGNIDWDAVCRAFAEIGYSGNLNYEASSFLQRLPYALRADAAKYMASTARYLRAKIEEDR